MIFETELPGARVVGGGVESLNNNIHYSKWVGITLRKNSLINRYLRVSLTGQSLPLPWLMGMLMRLNSSSGLFRNRRCSCQFPK